MPAPSPKSAANGKPQSNQYAPQAAKLRKELDVEAVLIVVMGGEKKAGYGVAADSIIGRMLPDFLIQLGNRWKREVSAADPTPEPQSAPAAAAPSNTPPAAPEIARPETPAPAPGSP